MIRASTGRPSVGHRYGDDDDDDRRKAFDCKFRPSSAGAKLQSRSYVGLSDENRPFTVSSGKPGVYIKTGESPAPKHQGIKSAKPPLGEMYRFY